MASSLPLFERQTSRLPAALAVLIVENPCVSEPVEPLGGKAGALAGV